MRERQEEIFALACAMADAEQGEREALEILCTAAENEMLRRLREGVSEEDCAEELVCACAMIAVSGLLTCRCGSAETASVKAGEVELRRASAETMRESAVLLRGQAERMMAPWCTDESFAFYGVRG